jgi:hypothetical protein
LLELKIDSGLVQVKIRDGVWCSHGRKPGIVIPGLVQISQS